MTNLQSLRDTKTKLGTNVEVSSFINTLYDNSSKINLKNHRDWYLNDRFLRGEHWIVYDKTMGRVVNIPIDNGEIRRTINKVRSQVRGVKNFIKRSQPRFTVEPNDASDEAYDEANSKNKILSYVYRKCEFPKILTDTIVNSLKYSVGIIEGAVIDDIDKKIIKFWVDDTFDVVFDPSAVDIDSCRFIIKAVKRPVEEILNNKNYKVEQKEIGSDREAASDYKNMMELEKSNPEQKAGNDDLKTTIVKELWMKYIRDGKRIIRVITVAGNNVIADQETKYKRYPFFIYNPERNGNGIYSEPWIKDLISLNKALDKTASQVESYIHRMLGGKWLIKQGVEVSTITDKGAEKIYYKGNQAPVMQNLQPLPAAPANHMRDLERWIEELGGTREASLGTAPGSLQSGKAIEALQAADAGVVAEPVENLEFLIKEIGEFILEIIAEYQETSDKIVEDRTDVKFIGKVAKTIPTGTIVVGGNEKVKVEIQPEISYSSENRKEWMMRLAEAKIIDEQTLLERLQFTNVADIIERVKKAKEEKFKQDMTMQRESHRTDGGAPQDSAGKADNENMQMASGQDVPPTPLALWTPEHLQLHMAFIDENKDAYSQNQQLFDTHISQEEGYSNQGEQPQEDEMPQIEQQMNEQV